MTRDRSSIIATGISVGTALFVGFAVFAAVMGCSPDRTAAPGPARDQASVYWRLVLNHHGAQLSLTKPYDTVRLVATARTPNGGIWVPPADGTIETGPTVFKSLNPSATVSADGLVTMVANGGSTIIATRQIGGVTRADTMKVNAFSFAAPQLIDSMRIRPDSAKRAVSDQAIDLSPFGLYGSNPVRFAAVTYYMTSSDTTVAYLVNPFIGSLFFRKPGKTLVTTTAYAYGRALTDTFTLTVGYSLNSSFAMTKDGFIGSRREIGPGGHVTWINNTGQKVDVIFDDPSKALQATSATSPSVPNSGTGNILALDPTPAPTTAVPNPPAQRRTRLFATPGEYRFTVQPFGWVGSVLVQSY